MSARRVETKACVTRHAWPNHDLPCTSQSPKWDVRDIYRRCKIYWRWKSDVLQVRNLVANIRWIFESSECLKMMPQVNFYEDGYYRKYTKHFIAIFLEHLTYVRVYYCDIGHREWKWGLASKQGLIAGGPEHKHEYPCPVNEYFLNSKRRTK
jgi:hypothetical protein